MHLLHISHLKGVGLSSVIETFCSRETNFILKAQI